MASKGTESLGVDEARREIASGEKFNVQPTEDPDEDTELGGST
jgi:hypothetical protein